MSGGVDAWRSSRAATAATALALLVALAANYLSLVPMVASHHGDFDAVHLYFPLARELLAQGLAFLGDERSLQAPLFSYVYPALLGTSMATVKVANAALSGVTLLAVFRSAWLLHSRAAGVIAALLFALSPTLRPHLATPMTEAPYFLLTAIWFWGLAEWLVSRRRWALAVSAVAISLAALTRATMFYGIVLMVAGAALLAWRGRGEVRARAREALLAYGAGLAPMLALAAKNWLLFHFPFYATGGANALYLGNNPLTGGYDPNYLGLHFDVGAIARDQSHLTLEADRLLGGAARIIFADKGWAFLADMHARKLAAFVFVTAAEHDALLQRSWRIALLVFSLGCLPRSGAQRAAAWILVAMLGYQIAIHVPVLYVHRYSVDAMDLWLVIAAGVGVARWGFGGQPRRLVAGLAAAGLGIAAGAYLMHAQGRPTPDVFAVARWRVWQAPPGSHVLSPSAERLDLPFADAPELGFDVNNVLVIEATNGPAPGCGELRASFRPAGAANFSAPIPFSVRPEGKPGRYQYGTIPLGLKPEGTLRLEARCPPGAELRLLGVDLYAAHGANDYRARFTGEPPPGRFER